MEGLAVNLNELLKHFMVRIERGEWIYEPRDGDMDMDEKAESLNLLRTDGFVRVLGDMIEYIRIWEINGLFMDITYRELLDVLEEDKPGTRFKIKLHSMDKEIKILL
jgi:hypothetical protein